MREAVFALARQYANEDMGPDDDECAPGCSHDAPCIECIAEKIMDMLPGESESESESEIESTGDSSSGSGSESESESESESGESGESESDSESVECMGNAESESDGDDTAFIDGLHRKTLIAVSRDSDSEADDVPVSHKRKRKDATTMRKRVQLSPERMRMRAECESIDAIRIEQRRTNLAIDPAAFRRLVAEIVFDFSRDTVCTSQAVAALQAAAEAYLVRLYEDANLAAIHAGREVVAPKDIHIARRLAREMC